ncbi:hypothetical protein FSST1_010511 [Fusarium sambucinum]
MHRHNHTPTWERGLDGVTRECPVMNDPLMSDDPDRNGYACLPAITTPTDSSSGWDTDMVADDGSNHSKDVEDATQEMERMSIDISNFEDNEEMDMTDYDGDTEM